MQSLLSNIQIKINDKIYVKDPETSTLGKKIIEQSILLIDEIGFEEFTFKKLGEKIQSNESSIYRYFENKHKLLLYLSSWYWSWIEYRLVFGTMNINDSEKKLLKAITIVTEKIEDDLTTTHINESILSKIIISEFSKTLHTKEVDEENKEGFFLIYKRVIQRLANSILEMQPEYPFAKCLASTIVEGALHQHYSRLHFKTITECNDAITPTDFYCHLISQLFQIKL
jgi:AcrR family transcriptional regulator